MLIDFPLMCAGFFAAIADELLPPTELYFDPASAGGLAPLALFGGLIF